MGIFLIHSVGTRGLILSVREQFCNMYEYLVAYRHFAISTGKHGKSLRDLQGDTKRGGPGGRK
jgi:hypothetical protein